MELPGRSKLRCEQGKKGFASWGGTLRRGASNTAVRLGGGGLSDAAVPPLAPTGGVLSEGEKRDSKGDMPDPLCRSPRLVNPRGDIREASACRGDFAPEPASRTRPVCAACLFVRRSTLLTRFLFAEEDPRAVARVGSLPVLLALNVCWWV